MAPAWIAQEDYVREICEPPGRRAMDRLRLQAGDQVVDLGCGAGQTTLDLSGRVGSAGTVLGIDVVSAFVGHARNRARQAAVSNVTFVVADAQAHRFEAGAFNAAYSRFGVMFYDDPVLAFSNIRRALRVGGAIAFCCWGDREHNEWSLLPTVTVARCLGRPVPPGYPADHNPASLSDPNQVRDVLQAAGFRDIDVVADAEPVAVAESFIREFSAASLRMLSAVRRLLAGETEATHNRCRAELETALRSRIKDGAVRLSRSALVVAATTRPPQSQP